MQYVELNKKMWSSYVYLGVETRARAFWDFSNTVFGTDIKDTDGDGDVELDDKIDPTVKDLWTNVDIQDFSGTYSEFVRDYQLVTNSTTTYKNKV